MKMLNFKNLIFFKKGGNPYWILRILKTQQNLI